MKKNICTLIIVLFQFAINAQLKHLNSLAGNSVGESAVSNNGKYLLSLQYHDLIIYDLNATNGALTKKKTFSNLDNEEFMNVNLSPDDKFLYVRSRHKKDGNLISVLRAYAINWSTFEFNLIQSIDNQDGTNYEFNAKIKISPQGNYMLVAHQNSCELFVYKRSTTTGLLTFTSKKNVDGSHFGEFEMSYDERFLYTAPFNHFKALVVFEVDKQLGSLNEIQQFDHPYFKSYHSDKLLISPNNKFIYSIGTDTYAKDRNQSHITIYNRDRNTGLISYNTHYSNLKNEKIENINFIYMDKSGETLYALTSLGNVNHTINVFKANPIDGSLSKIQTINDGGATNKLRGVYDVDFSKSNKFVYFSAARDNAITIMENPLAKPSYNHTEEVLAQGNEEIEAEENAMEQESNEVVETTNPTESAENSNLKPITKEFYEETWRKLQMETSDAKKMDLCYDQLEGQSMKTVQVAAMAILFNSEYKRLEFVKFMSYFTSDKENYKILVDLFTYSAIKEDFIKSTK